MNENIEKEESITQQQPSFVPPGTNVTDMGQGEMPRTSNTMENYLLITGGKPPTDLTSLGWIKQLDFYKPVIDERVLWETKVISNNSFPDALACLPAQAIQRGDRSQEFF